MDKLKEELMRKWPALYRDYPSELAAITQRLMRELEGKMCRVLTVDRSPNVVLSDCIKIVRTFYEEEHGC